MRSDRPVVPSVRLQRIGEPAVQWELELPLTPRCKSIERVNIVTSWRRGERGLTIHAKTRHTTHTIRDNISYLLPLSWYGHNDSSLVRVRSIDLRFLVHHASLCIRFLGRIRFRFCLVLSVRWVYFNPHYISESYR